MINPAGWSVKLEHYLNTLLRKPGAVHASLALQKMPETIQKLLPVDSHIFVENNQEVEGNQTIIARLPETN